MKKIGFLLILLMSTALYSQAYNGGWGVGFGLTSPRMFGDTYAENMNFGGHIFVQKDLDEVNALRLKLDYLNFTSKSGATLPSSTPPATTAETFELAYLYTFGPCNPYKFYFGTGLALAAYTVKNSANTAIIPNKSVFGELIINFIVGAKYTINKEWDAKGEFGYHQVSTDRFDGVSAPGGGLFGGTLDAYVSCELGVVYYWERGPLSKLCDNAPGGITNIYNTTSSSTAGSTTTNALPSLVDYDRIQKMIDAGKTAPTQVDYKRLEDMVESKVEKFAKATNEQIALIGINFDVNESKIKSENVSILAQDAFVLLSHPSVNVEVVGYTDVDGNEKSNTSLSEKRANNVKNYLVAKGVSASRISVKALGEANPVADNKTADGKALNRRVEIKVVK